ncbi:MAG: hypothetical protein HY820_42790 [Acidobacteria bacterium]|nr:hypothetical protein [Acidobacteriota bacterium]
MNPNWNLWMRQTWAVMRLEIGKSFFSKRGLWIYLLAFAPIVIWGGHSYEVMERGEDRQKMAQRSPGVTRQKMAMITDEMSKERILAILGPPARQQSFGRRHPVQIMRWSDGKAEFIVRFRDGELENISLREGCSFEEDSTVFAAIFQFFYLRLAIFWGCVFVFMNLFRGEMLDKSLHYYFLAPIRREVVVAGKFGAGLLATGVIFGVSIALQFAGMNLHFPKETVDQYFSQGHAIQHLLSYIGVSILACAGYGSAFLVGGILLRNPLIPAGVLLLWESINGILPAILRKFSVIYYLKVLSPVAIPLDKGVPGPLAMLAFGTDPVSTPVAIIGVFGLALVLLVVAAWRSRSMEISYAAE